MPKIVTIIGRSGSGKTYLIEKLTKYLRDKGFRISIIKHMKHDFEIDHYGKDTYRYREAGAFSSLITNDRKFAVISDIEEEMSPVDLANKYMTGSDIVLIEGYKQGDLQKIEVIGDSDEPHLFMSGFSNIIAIVTDRSIDTMMPVFKRDEIEHIGDFIILANYEKSN